MANGIASLIIDEIDVNEVCESLSRRALNEETVARLMQDMARFGLQQPITVRRVDRDVDGVVETVFELVAGGHRLESARRLGWTTIACIIQSLDDTQARMVQIGENLHRSELTAMERSEQIAEYADLSDKLGQLVPVSKGGRGVEGGVRKAARDLPVAGATPEAKRKTVARAKKIAAISPEAKAAAVVAGLDNNQSALLTIAAKPGERQLGAVDEVVAARTKPKSVMQLITETAASDEDRTRSFLARAADAERGAKVDDLAGLEFTAEMEAAREAVVEAWDGNGSPGHEQRHAH